MSSYLERYAELERNEPIDSEIVYLLNKYKNSIRKQLGKSILLAEPVDQDDSFSDQHSPEDYTCELSSLKTDLNEKNRKIDLTPFYESLVDALGERREETTSEEDREIWSAICTSVLTKATALRGRSTKLVIDVDKYEDIINDNLEKLDEVDRNDIVMKYQDQDRFESNVKTDEASTLIHVPIDEDEENAELNISIEETVANEDSAVDRIRINKQETLKRLKVEFLLRTAFIVLEAVGTEPMYGGSTGMNFRRNYRDAPTTVRGRFVEFKSRSEQHEDQCNIMCALIKCILVYSFLYLFDFLDLFHIRILC